LTIATSDKWTDKQTGEKREQTEWHRVVIFNEKLSEIAEKFLRKGAKVYVRGSLRTRKWTDNDGVDRYSTEVILQGFDCKLIMLSSADRNGEQGHAQQDGKAAGGGQARATSNQNQQTQGRGGQAAPATASGRVDDFQDDEIPF